MDVANLQRSKVAFPSRVELSYQVHTSLQQGVNFSNNIQQLGPSTKEVVYWIQPGFRFFPDDCKERRKEAFAQVSSL